MQMISTRSAFKTIPDIRDDEDSTLGKCEECWYAATILAFIHL